MSEHEIGTAADHEHTLRKEHVGPPHEDAMGNVAVEVWVACTHPDCEAYWTGGAELTLDESAYEDL